ncbi:nuclear apoptosis-inducing factor 1-like isoform X1 [Onthophagus taurus]|uniref:nuclear apoptosis-inducing factor 1-like isoform X1 n=1 Tax=Onthophagus taurus TaxID=166361 RepID=UPI0039BE8B25
MDRKRSKRSTNYTKEECWRLIQLVEKLANVIENKKTDGVTWREKKRAWQKICQTFNSTGKTNRTSQQLRSKYETLKKEVRQAVAKHRADVSSTGGGPCKVKLSPLHERVQSLIQPSGDGTPSQFDSEFDCLDIKVEPQHLITFVDDELKGDEAPLSPNIPVAIDAEQIEVTNTSIYESNNTEVTDADDIVEEDNNRSHYSPVQLRKAKYLALQTRKRNRASKNINLSAAGREMQPWLDAKADLTNLKIKLLQEEFDAKQQREKELHEQQCQINKQLIEINNLTIKKTLLEIEKILDG